MKKIICIAFLMFFVHSILLFLILSKLNSSLSERSSTPGNGIVFLIAIFLTTIIYFISLILIFIEKKMEFNYKPIMRFLVCGNCILEFYLNSIVQYQIFNRPDRFNKTAIIFIIFYFVSELFLTYYAINGLYKTEEN